MGNAARVPSPKRSAHPPRRLLELRYQEKLAKQQQQQSPSSKTCSGDINCDCGDISGHIHGNFHAEVIEKTESTTVATDDDASFALSVREGGSLTPMIPPPSFGLETGAISSPIHSGEHLLAFAPSASQAGMGNKLSASIAKKIEIARDKQQVKIREKKETRRLLRGFSTNPRPSQEIALEAEVLKCVLLRENLLREARRVYETTSAPLLNFAGTPTLEQVVARVRAASIDVVEAVDAWRACCVVAQQGGGIPVSFEWEDGNSYLVKMVSDVSFLNVPLQEHGFDFSTAGNPLMVPPGDNSHFPVDLRARCQAASRVIETEEDLEIKRKERFFFEDKGRRTVAVSVDINVDLLRCRAADLSLSLRERQERPKNSAPPLDAKSMLFRRPNNFRSKNTSIFTTAMHRGGNPRAGVVTAGGGSSGVDDGGEALASSTVAASSLSNFTSTRLPPSLHVGVAPDFQPSASAAVGVQRTTSECIGPRAAEQAQLQHAQGASRREALSAGIAETVACLRPLVSLSFSQRIFGKGAGIHSSNDSQSTHDAAVVIQSVSRGRVARNHTNELALARDEAAVIFQALARSKAARNALAAERIERDVKTQARKKRETLAAVRIQRTQRGRAARARTTELRLRNRSMNFTVLSAVRAADRAAGCAAAAAEVYGALAQEFGAPPWVCLSLVPGKGPSAV